VQIFLGDYGAARSDYDAAIALSGGNNRGGFGLFRALISAYEGDRAASVEEIERLLGALDTMATIDRATVTANALNVQVLLAAEEGDATRATRGVERLTALWAADAGAPAGTRARRAAEIAFLEGVVALKEGRTEATLAKAEEAAAAVGPLNDPRADELPELLRGLVALRAERWEDAVARFDRVLATHVSNSDVIDRMQWIEHHRALALE